MISRPNLRVSTVEPGGGVRRGTGVKQRIEQLRAERREARRESLPTSETNKFSRFKTWLTSKINGRIHLRKADESVKKAAETLKTATEMIYQIDDTMTQGFYIY